MDAEPAPQPKRSGVPAWAWVLIGLAVCGCGGMVTAILFPVFMSAKVAAERTQSLSHMKNMVVAMEMFQSAHDDMYPNVQSDKVVVALMAPYLDRMSSTELNPPSHQIRFNFRLAGHSVSDLKNVTATIVFYESEPRYDTRYVAFADGHVLVLRSEKWAAAQDLMNNPFEKDAKTTKAFAPTYQSALSALHDRLMAGDRTAKPTLTQEDLKLVNPDFATGEPSKEPLKS